MESTCSTDIKDKPEILTEIDKPFPAECDSPGHVEDIPTLIKLKDQEHSHHVEDLKNTIGKKLLYGCLIAIVCFAVADAIWHIESPMFSSAFEVAKIVATTVLGYLFGSKVKS